MCNARLYRFLGCEIKHIVRRCSTSSIDQRIDKPGEVADRGDQRTAARGAGHGRVDSGEIDPLSVELSVAMRVSALDRSVPGAAGR
jgi:hypothetical protein